MKVRYGIDMRYSKICILLAADGIFGRLYVSFFGGDELIF